MRRDVKQNAAGIEVNTRVKLIRTAKDHFTRMSTNRAEAISAINKCRPIDRTLALVPEFNGRLALEAPANVQGDSEQFAAWLGRYDKILRQLERVILEGEALVKGELRGAHDLDVPAGEGWVCGSCGEVNEADALICDACDASHLERLLDGADWD